MNATSSTVRKDGSVPKEGVMGTRKPPAPHATALAERVRSRFGPRTGMVRLCLTQACGEPGCECDKYEPALARESAASVVVVALR